MKSHISTEFFSGRGGRNEENKTSNGQNSEETTNGVAKPSDNKKVNPRENAVDNRNNKGTKFFVKSNDIFSV